MQPALYVKSWAIPEPGILMITVGLEPLKMQEDFYRVRSQTNRWVWAAMSVAGSPTAHVQLEAFPLLNHLVLEHPVLQKVAIDFGLDAAE